MSQFWDIYGITFEFAFVLGLFALSAFLGLWSGVLSLAPIAYASGAAYVSARLAYDKVMMGEANYPLVFHLFVGMVVGGFLAWITSFVLLRLGSHYLALATIALVLIARVIALNLDEYTGTTSNHHMAHFAHSRRRFSDVWCAEKVAIRVLTRCGS
jgi:branched-chain amino acid transport system permease protein